MPRRGREYCEGGCYHIIIRGVNRQNIFQDRYDRLKFVETVRRFAEETAVGVIAYCLMDNHVHILMQAADGPGLFVKKLASSYVFYYNHKYDRIGHLFQDRYKSEAVDTDAYLLVAARYILQNPQKAGICDAERYEWSSWREMEGGGGFCHIQTLCDLIGSKSELMAFLRQQSDDRCIEVYDRRPIKDPEAAHILRRISGLDNPLGIAGLDKDKKREVIQQAKKAGLTVRQLSRLTGMDRNAVQRA